MMIYVLASQHNKLQIMSLDKIFSAIQQRASEAGPIGATMRFDLGDTHIYLDGTGETNIVTQENKEAECTVQIKPNDLESLIQGKLNPVAAFMSGKIKVKGNMGVAMKLQSFLN